jgi:hypothetical protein
MSAKKQTWVKRHHTRKGHSTTDIVRYSDSDKLLDQLFGGCVPDGFAVSLNTPERIELTFDDEPDFYFEPIGRCEVLDEQN